MPRCAVAISARCIVERPALLAEAGAAPAGRWQIATQAGLLRALERNAMRAYLNDLPLIAILRGIMPPRPCRGPGAARWASHHRGAIEFAAATASIEALARELGDRCLVGAGTVVSALRWTRWRALAGG